MVFYLGVSPGGRCRSHGATRLPAGSVCAEGFVFLLPAIMLSSAEEPRVFSRLPEQDKLVFLIVRSECILIEQQYIDITLASARERRHALLYKLLQLAYALLAFLWRHSKSPLFLHLAARSVIPACASEFLDLTLYKHPTIAGSALNAV